MPSNDSSQSTNQPAQLALSADGGATPTRLRWVMIGLAFSATIINYLDRQVLSVTAPLLKQQFAVSDSAYGLILSGFMLAYTVPNGRSGPMIDRVGTRRA